MSGINGMIRFSAFLKQYRADHDISRRELADLLFCDENSIRQWELGIHIPQYRYHMAIIEVFGEEALKDVIEFNIGRLLRNIMEQNGITQKELARRIGRTQATICYIMNGKRVCREETMQMILENLVKEA